MLGKSIHSEQKDKIFERKSRLPSAQDGNK